MSFVLIAPGTGGGTADVETKDYAYVVISAGGLATTETVTVEIVVDGNTTEVVAQWVLGPFDDPANPRATALTADVQSVTFVGGPRYRVTSSATAASVGVYADFQPRP